MIQINKPNSCIYIIDFAARYAIDGRLLGKHILFRPCNDYVLEIVFPSLKVKNHDAELYMPGLFNQYDVDMSSWGKVNRFNPNNIHELTDSWLSSILVKSYSDDIEKLPTYEYIQKQSIRILHILHVINPDSIRSSTDEVENEICEVGTVVCCQKGNAPRIQLNLSACNFDTRDERLTISDIKLALQNVNFPVTAPYEMLDNAYRNLSVQDTRSAVLNCATAIEIMLKKMISRKLDTIVFDDKLKDGLLKDANGFTKLVELCKKCSIPLGDIPKLKDSVFGIRNRVIHGGYVPDSRESKNIYEISRRVLSEHNTPLFETQI